MTAGLRTVGLPVWPSINVAPTRANGTFWPAATLGAPQTTVCCSPPTSTVARTRRSALGWRETSTTRPTVTPLQSPPVVMTSPTSAPAIVRRRASSTGSRVRSTYSESHLRGTRIVLSELGQEAQVVGVEEADVLDAVAEHGDALDPAGAGAGAAALAAAEEAVDSELHPRLDEREVVAAERRAAFRAEDAVSEVGKRALQVAQADPLVDGEPLNLHHHPLVGRVRGLVAVAPPRHDHPDRRLRLVHHPALHRRGVGAEEHRPFAVPLVVDPEGVPHVAGGVVAGDAEGLEVVAVPLHLRAFDDLEAHGDEAVQDVAQGLRGGMEAPGGEGRPGQRDVDAIGGEGFGQRVGELLLAGLEPGLP